MCQNCSSLDLNVTIPANIHTISNTAFQGVHSLALDLTNAGLNDSAINNMFSTNNGFGLSSLVNIKFPTTFSWDKNSSNLRNGLMQIAQPFDMTIPSSCTIPANYFACHSDGTNGIKIRKLNVNILSDIGTQAFQYNKTLTEFRIADVPGSLTKKTATDPYMWGYYLPASTFEGCTNLKYFDCLSLNSNITGFLDNAFNGCLNLTNVFFNAKNIYRLNTGCFANCILRVDQETARTTKGYNGELKLGYSYRSIIGNMGSSGNPSEHPIQGELLGYQPLQSGAFKNTRILDGDTLKDTSNVVGTNKRYSDKVLTLDEIMKL